MSASTGRGLGPGRAGDHIIACLQKAEQDPVRDRVIISILVFASRHEIEVFVFQLDYFCTEIQHDTFSYFQRPFEADLIGWISNGGIRRRWVSLANEGVHLVVPVEVATLDRGSDDGPYDSAHDLVVSADHDL